MLYWIISRNIALLLVLYCTVLCSIVFVSCLAMHDAVIIWQYLLFYSVVSHCIPVVNSVHHDEAERFIMNLIGSESFWGCLRLSELWAPWQGTHEPWRISNNDANTGCNCCQYGARA